MKRKVGMWIHGLILTLILMVSVGSLSVYAEDVTHINHRTATVNIGDEDNKLHLEMENWKEGDRKPRWVSYNVNVASVDQNGTVTALRKGRTIISSGIGFPREACVVTVVEPTIKVNKKEATIYSYPSDSTETAGKSVTLKATVKGAEKNVIWSSDNENIAAVTVDAQGRGLVTAVRQAGTAVITAEANGKKASCKVTVLESAISLNMDEIKLSTKGAGSSIKLTPTIVGAKKKVTWTSSDQAVAAVKGGKVTGKWNGDEAKEAVITARANGVTAECKVIVDKGMVSINEEKILLYVKKGNTETQGETKTLKTNAPQGSQVIWSSDNVAAATVSDTGLVTAKGAGVAVITAECNGKKDTCKVEVKNTSASIAERVVHLKTKGSAKTYKLAYQVTGRKTASRWKSSNTKVVSVSKGKLTAKKAGTATVTLEANGIRDEVQITVQDFTPTIALNQREYTLYTKGKGNNVALKATISGAGKKAVWKSSDKNVAEVTSKGRVTAKGTGRALITASANGVTAKCWISVKEPKIVLEKNELVIKVGEKQNLWEQASMEVSGASQSVTCKSSDTKIATVNGKGVITAKKKGAVKITVKANGVENTCRVTVTECESCSFGAAETVREASCEENGLISYTCTVCGGKKQETTDALGHAYGKWSVETKATEHAAGLEKQVCTRCHAENTRSIPARNKEELAYAYTLEWEDDFNGDTLNEADWNYETHEPGWVNAELQEYVKSSDNIFVKDGNLVIKAIKTVDPATGKASYTSGRINTQNKHDYQYGRFEVRAKVPGGKGFLPAFWMMPTDESFYGQWPKCGEIDVMEVLGDQTDKVHGTLHFGEPHTQKQGTFTLPEGEADFAEDFHVFACEWDPDEFRYYVDGRLFYTENDWFTKRPGFGETAYPAPYDQPFYMILNLAVGGSWVGYPDETTEFGENAQLVVDYVRVYQRDDYDTDIDKPEQEVNLRDPDETGNYIINGDFSKAEDLSKGDENWQLLLTGGGEATAEIAENALHITTENMGTLNYSVQIVQADLPIEEGSKYKLSYEAYADEARTMITGITAPDRGYIRYLDDTTVNLTTEKQTFEHTFDMKSNSDANGRVEFNLGNQNSAAGVHITNVRLEKAGDAEEEVKGVLPDGNYVYNGSFNEGNEPGRLRLAYWDWDIDQCRGAGVSVTSDYRRELKVTVPETVSALNQVVVSQTPVAITGGKKYALSFEAYADSARTIQSTIAGQTFDTALTTERTEYKYEFETAADLNGSELRFLLGAAGTTYIDNVSVREDGMIVNGDFSNGLVGYEVYVADDAKVPGYIVDSLNEKDAFSIDIADTADQDWKIQLKQNNIKLEKDKWYQIAFDAKSTQDRQIMYALQRDGSSDDNWIPYSGTQKISLTGDYQNFSHVFKMAEDTDPRTILSISMGAVGGTRIQTKHTVVIDNITLEETQSQEQPPVEAGENLIKNGDFAQGGTEWENAVTAPGEATVSFADQKAAYHITNVGTEDWNIQLKQAGLTLEKGAEYEVTMKLKSSAARIVKYAFLTAAYDWYGGEDLSLNAGEVKEAAYKFTVDKETDNNITFVISMGQIKVGEELVDTPVSAIEIDDISVIKVKNGDGSGEEVPPTDIGTELIKNGNFAAGEENWSHYVDSAAKAETLFEGGKARYEITNAGTADWNIQLKQEGLAMEKGASYKVNFKIGASIGRDLKLAFMGAGDAWHGGTDINLKKDKQLSVSRIVKLEDKDIAGTLAFQLSLGETGTEQEGTTEKLAAHAVEISDISVVKVEAGTEADPETETDVTIAPPAGETEPEEPDEGGDDDTGADIGTELIKNGNFAAGEENWSHYVDSAAKAETLFEGGKARYEITNAGTADWNIQLKQEGLAMEKGASYKVNFKIGASIGRDLKLAFMGAGDAWHGGTDINLKKDKQLSVSRIVKLEDKDIAGTLAFQLSLGETGTEQEGTTEKLAAHAVEISDISVVKVEAGTEVDPETETETTITPPVESSDSGDNGGDGGTTGDNIGNGGDGGTTDDSVGDGGDGGTMGDNIGNGGDGGTTDDSVGDGSDGGTTDDSVGDGSDGGTTGDNGGN